MDRLVAFDFDGVLVDAREEIVHAAVKTFNELCEGRLEYGKAFSGFTNARHLIRTGRDVMPVMHFIAMGRDLEAMERGEIAGLKEKWGEKKVIEMEKEYFKRKTALRENSKKWISLIKPFPQALEALGTMLREEKTVIASTREKKAIVAYLKSWGLDFPEGKVFDWSVSHDKREQFREISRVEGISFENMVFAEDVLLNALAVKELGVRVLLSTWGFSSEEQWKEAEEQGIVPVKQDGLLPGIRKALNSIEE